MKIDQKAPMRRVAAEAQLLDDSTGSGATSGVGAIEEVLESAGWLRTLGGVDAYLALRERTAAARRRRSADEALVAGVVRIVPAVRGCIYLVARRDVPLALRCADLLTRRRRQREFEKVGLVAGEIERLSTAILDCLGTEPASTAQLRSRLPKDLVRSFGDLGKKIGLSSNLPPVLRELEFAGRIRRAPAGDGLDHEKYLWTEGRGTVASELDALGEDPVPVVELLAARFVSWIGVARLSAFVSWSGFGQRLARQAFDRLRDAGIETCDVDRDRILIDPASTPTATSAQAERLCLLPFEDNLVQLQGGVGPLVDSELHHVEVPRWGNSPRPVALGQATHLGVRPAVRAGQLVGFWEVDPEDRRCAVVAALPGESAAELQQAADRAAGFLDEELGHAKWFSIDTETSLARRAREVLDLAEVLA